MALGNGAEMRNVMALTSKQRAYLGGCASTMDPIFHIGKASIRKERADQGGCIEKLY